MAGNRTSFTKRQKERARQERQAEKAQKRLQRKQETTESTPAAQPSGGVVIAHDEEGQPLPLDFHDFE